MRIGLLGGSFNPIHRCHLIIAAETRDHLHLNQVLFIPSGDPPHKPSTGLAPAHHRCEMVRLAIDAEPSFSLSDLELHRAEKSYTIETVRALRLQLGSAAELVFILGLDAFLDFPSWRHPAELLELCHFVVVSRPASQFTSLEGFPFLPAADPEALRSLDARRQDRLDLPLPGGTAVTLLHVHPCDVSASEIRRRISVGESVSGLLPAPVESYIIRYGLFREDTNHTRL